jgi:hypothetical protein
VSSTNSSNTDGDDDSDGGFVILFPHRPWFEQLIDYDSTNMKQVFPKPSQREFFYKCGFRLSHRFIMMKFTKETAPPMASEALRPTIQLILAENGKIVADFDAIAEGLEEAVALK